MNLVRIECKAKMHRCHSVALSARNYNHGEDKLIASIDGLRGSFEDNYKQRDSKFL